MKHVSSTVLDFDVVVVGGGHAGCEAAHAAARMGVRTALVTHCFDRIGEMSCNPAMGGLGKGHLVREVDALDGLVGRMADRAGIHFRLLNRRKGPAVQGPRVQCDRDLYRTFMQREIRRTELSVVEGEVSDLVETPTGVGGVVLADGSRIGAAAVILTTGTFLNGTIHIGRESHRAGRLGDPAVAGLAERIGGFGLALGRLKTGTPPRLVRETIDFSLLEEQPSDDERVGLSSLDVEPAVPVISCHVTWTDDLAHGIVRRHLGSSAIYSGKIAGTSPRYCPSIEDKVVRFADKAAHRIFLEPEGARSDLVYPNGLSMSLPPSVQAEIVRSIKGLERCEIARPGYAVEYDYVDPRGLDRRLAVRGVEGLFLAGQINGTTGYEEAAAQGLAAGVNAAAAVSGRAPILFSRHESYVGVMIDDLVTQGVTEPYRMFTSRAEYRLSLRADNADQRLTPLGIEIGCVRAARRTVFLKMMEKLRYGRAILEEISLTPGEAASQGLSVCRDGQRRNGLDLLAIPSIDVERLSAIDPRLAALDPQTVRQIERDSVYSVLLERQARDAEALRVDEARPLDTAFDYGVLRGLSNELREKLSLVRPESVGQAARIEGMTPAALTLVAAKARGNRGARG